MAIGAAFEREGCTVGGAGEVMNQGPEAQAVKQGEPEDTDARTSNLGSQRIPSSAVAFPGRATYATEAAACLIIQKPISIEKLRA